MKKRIWIHSPATYILLLLLIGLTVSNYYGFVSRPVFTVLEIICTVLALVIVIIGSVTFRKYLKRALNAAVRSITPAHAKWLEEFPLPTVVVGEMGDIIWFNRLFTSRVSFSEEIAGLDITPFLSGKKITDVVDGGQDISYGGRLYTVYAVKGQDEQIVTYTLYYIDNTYYKTISREFKESRPVVALIVFDNLEEISQAAKAGEVSQISAEVEMRLDRWISQTTGFLRKIGTDRYLVFAEERHLKGWTENQFHILDEIHEIKLGGKMNATVSIGIGHNAENIKDAFERAQQALDMALGRGGDQVAVKSSDGYSFFGGISKGVEKRSRVRTRIVTNAMAGLFNNCETVYIMGHRNSDLDCVGAAVGMWSLVSRGFGKQAYIVVDKTTTLAGPLLKYIHDAGGDERFITPQQAMQMSHENAVLVVVDTHSRDFLESRELYDACKEVVVIDHHRKMVNYIDRTVVFYHEPFASSASEMVAELVEYLAEDKLQRTEADALLSGIMLDTKNFVLKTGVRTFEAAAFLKRKGADTVEVKCLFSNSFDSYKVKYQIVADAEIYDNMAIAVAEEPDADLRVVSAQAADELLGIEGVEASFVLYAIPGGVSVSARSFGKVNVQVLMEKLGGGGHLTMAGAQVSGASVAEIRQKLLNIISEFSARRVERQKEVKSALQEKNNESDLGESTTKEGF